MQEINLAGLCLVMVALSTARGIRCTKGEPLAMVECGAATSALACYDLAAKECPKGYQTVAEESDITRKTLKMECKE